jgi:hypothetical protein
VAIWEHEIWDRGYPWLRNVMQGAGAAIGLGIASLQNRSTLVLIVIGALYGTLVAGLGYQLRAIVRGGPDDRALAPILFAGYLGAALGFSYFFFLSGTECGIERLLFSPVYAVVGWLVGAAAGWGASQL